MLQDTSKVLQAIALILDYQDLWPQLFKASHVSVKSIP